MAGGLRHLCCNCVGAGWEELGDTSCVETVFCKTHCGTQTSPTGTDDECIVFMVDDVVFLRNSWNEAVWTGGEERRRVTSATLC